MHVRLWDFGTLKSHSLKVSMQIFTIFQHLWYRNSTATSTMRTKWSPKRKGVERKITIDGILKMVKSQKYQIPFTISRVNIV